EGAEIFDDTRKYDTEKLREAAVKTASEFLDANPQIEPSNWAVIVDWMRKRKLSPTLKNFEIAYDTLGKSGALAEPVVTQELIDSMTADEFRDRLLRDESFREAAERFR